MSQKSSSSSEKEEKEEKIVQVKKKSKIIEQVNSEKSPDRTIKFKYLK